VTVKRYIDIKKTNVYLSSHIFEHIQKTTIEMHVPFPDRHNHVAWLNQLMTFPTSLLIIGSPTAMQI